MLVSTSKYNNHLAQGHKGNTKPDKYDFKLKFGIQNPDSIKVNFSFYLKGQK